MHLCSGSNTLIPTLSGYLFRPEQVSVDHTADLSGVDFLANPTLAVTLAGSSQIQLDGGGTTGVLYRIEASTNLLNWQSIVTNPAPIRFIDDIVTNSGKYYRLGR